MGVYNILTTTAPQSAPGTAQVDGNGLPLLPGANLPTGSQLVTITGGSGEIINPNTVQSFHVIATTSSGNVTASVQPIVSNDGVNWINYGSAIAISSGASPQQAQGNGTAFWKYMSAYCSAMTGTGALVKCIMAA